MPVRISWDCYETALLCDAYERAMDGSDIDAEAKMLSITLRNLAVSRGFLIDDTYRNINGIRMKLFNVQYVFTDGRRGLSNPSKMIRHVYELYKNDYAKYQMILKEAIRLTGSTVSIEEAFFAYAKDHLGFAPSMVANYLKSAAEYCHLKHPLLGMTDIKEVRNVQQKIAAGNLLYYRYGKDAQKIRAATQLYYYFIKSHRKLSKKTSVQTNLTNTVEQNHTLTIDDAAGAEYVPESQFVNNSNRSEMMDSKTNIVNSNENSPQKRLDPRLATLEQIVLQADMDGMSYDEIKDALQITMVLTKQLVAQSAKVVDIKNVLIHEDSFIDWEDGANAIETIVDKLMQKNNGYISSAQLFEYARSEMNMFLNDNDMCEERAVYDIAQHLFEKAHYHGKVFAFRGKMHISRVDTGIGSNMDVFRKYAVDQGGVFSFSGLVEHLESIGIATGNLRTQMRMQAEPIFFFYDNDQVAYVEALHVNEAWKKSIADSLKVLFDDVGDHMILRSIPTVWLDRLPAISGNHPWTPLLLQSVLRFYSKELGARTIQALDGQSLEKVHTMIVANDSPIQNFGDVIISYMLENEIDRRKFEAEELRLLLVDGGILHGNELIWNMPKALKHDGRFAWDASGNQVAIKV